MDRIRRGSLAHLGRQGKFSLKETRLENKRKVENFSTNLAINWRRSKLVDVPVANVIQKR